MTKNDAKYKTIFEVTPIPIWEEDFSGIKNLLIEKGLYGQDPTFVNDTLRNDRDLVLEFISVIKIVDFNDACVRLHHAKSKEDLKENFHALFTPEGYELVVKQLVTISQGLTSFEDESTTRTLDGKHKNISFKWKVVPGFEDSLKSVIITTEDITEEEILKQGLKELLKRYHLVTKATFEAIYDWDLATDMLIWGEGFRSIFGYQFDKIKPDYSTWKDNIHPDDVKDVIENVEAYLKSEDDNWQKEYRFRKANGQYVHVIDKSFVLRDLDGNVLRMVGALQDISEIKQANDELKSRSQFIQNIISNAIKYRRKGVDPIIKLDVNETDTHWKFVISDNGIGIADEYFERIFVIFQRLHNKEEYSGTGIGLAICKKIIENLGGKIWVESEENKGSRFLFILPKKAQIPT